MNKIVFSDNTEIHISNVSQSGDTLTITIPTDDVNSIIDKFCDESSTSVMRYYAGLDLIRGYSGFTNFENVTFMPEVIVRIDYEQTDPYTGSGFKEEKENQCVVTIKKKSMLSNIANQTAQNTANIDYLAMEAGIEL